MEINVLEKEKNLLKLELKEEGHTLCNALRKELWNDKSVKIAGYNIDHPLIGKPVLVVQSDNPKKSLQEAVKRLKKQNKEFSDKIKKIIK